MTLPDSNYSEKNRKREIKMKVISMSNLLKINRSDMKYFVVMLVVSFLSYSCDNKKQIIRELELNDITDLKYLLEYFDNNKSEDSCISPKCFNHFYNYLRILPINDSSWVFVRNICLSEYDKNDFLLHFENDSIKIYKPLKKMFETRLLHDEQFVYLSYREAIEDGNDSFEIKYDFGYNNLISYYKKSESGMIEFDFNYEFNSLLKSKDCRYFLYFEYDNHWNLGRSYAYEKTIENIITRPTLIFCRESNPCCPLNSYAYQTQEQEDKALKEARQRLW